MVKKSKSQIEAEKNAKETAVVVEDALRNIADKVGDIFKEALSSTDNVSKAIAKDITGTLNSLAKVSKDLADANIKAAEGAFRQADAAKLIQQRQAKIRAINYQILALDEEQVDAKADLLKELAKIENYNDEFVAGLQEQVSLSQKFNKQMGLTGVALGGLKSLAGNLGLGALTDTFDNAEAAAKEVVDVTGGLANQFKVLGAGLASLGKSFLSFLTSPVAMIGLLVKGFQSLLSLGQKFSQKTADIGKSFLGMGSGSATVVKNLKLIAQENNNMNFAEAKRAMDGINAVAGTSVMVSKEQANTYQEYVDLLGLSEEATQGLFKISELTGTSFGDIDDTIKNTVMGIDGASEASVNLTDIMNEVAMASSTTLANVGSSPEALAKAAFQAKRLGMTLDQIAAAGEASLDFESSIANEMEAELLLGKNLNLEALRSASLRGDEEQVAKEMNRILSENYDATEGNKIAQQALAKTLGVSVDEMHKMNQTRLLQNQLAKKGITDQDLAQKTLARFRKEGLTEAEAMAKLNEEELEFTKQKGIDAQATTRTLENAKELFMNSLAPLAEKVATAFSSLVNNEGFKTMLSSIAGVLKSIVGFVMDFPKSSLGIGLSAIFGGSLLKAVTGGKLGSSGNPMHVTMSKGGLMSSLLSKITGGGEGGGLGGIKFPKGKGMLKGAGKLAKGVLGKVAAPLAIGMALFDGFKGFNADKSASLGDKFKNAGSSALNGLSFGLLGQSADTISANAAVNGSNVPLPSNIAATTTAPTENEVVTLLKELIVAVKDGGDVYMDGNKVGRSLVLATSNMG
tara:strand:+ start:1864 stop:4266 length:2403 start_codon:yes stop_codon:yes gene_type:complete